ncbi:hypothetical protein HWV62_41422 [Athelia sp. TMB]|nr:hypothetical protein HWV62_41422 [Athelia sp. TMB]
MKARFNNIYHLAEAQTKEAFTGTHHRILVQALQYFTTFGARLPFATLVKQTKGVSNMMSTLWAAEATEFAVTLGFTAAGLLFPDLTVPFDKITFNRALLGQLMDNNGGNQSQILSI